jgi:hypothetical protein
VEWGRLVGRCINNRVRIHKSICSLRQLLGQVLDYKAGLHPVKVKDTPGSQGGRATKDEQKKGM